MRGNVTRKRYALQEAGYWYVASGATSYFGFALGPLYTLWYGYEANKRVDESWKAYRQDLKDCFQPYCPGFDPKAPGGPCDGCDPPLYCNPCELVDSGYICCIYEPSDCHGDCCHPSPGCP